MQLNEWLFEINVPKGMDAHYALVHWLRRNRLEELFTSDYKAITYVVFEYLDGYSLIAKSCVEIQLPLVEHNAISIDPKKPVKVAVQLSRKKRVKPPNLIHEKQSSVRHKTTVRLMTEVEQKARVLDVVSELGFDLSSVDYSIHDGIELPIHHKRQNMFINEQTMNVVIDGVITDSEKFEKAWRYGVGNKRVYGLGCVRILQ